MKYLKMFEDLSSEEKTTASDLKDICMNIFQDIKDDNEVVYKTFFMQKCIKIDITINDYDTIDSLLDIALDRLKYESKNIEVGVYWSRRKDGARYTKSGIIHWEDGIKTIERVPLSNPVSSDIHQPRVNAFGHSTVYQYFFARKIEVFAYW